MSHPITSGSAVGQNPRKNERPPAITQLETQSHSKKNSGKAALKKKVHEEEAEDIFKSVTFLLRYIDVLFLKKLLGHTCIS